jgi:hypothetical protein
MVLIVVATSSMWPNSSAAMFAIRSKNGRALAVAEIERLVGVVHQRRHLAEATAEQLLDGRGAIRVGVGRWRQLGAESVDAQDHEVPRLGWVWSRGSRYPYTSRQTWPVRSAAASE